MPPSYPIPRPYAPYLARCGVVAFGYLIVAHVLLVLQYKLDEVNMFGNRQQWFTGCGGLVEVILGDFKGVNFV